MSGGGAREEGKDPLAKVGDPSPTTTQSVVDQARPMYVKERDASALAATTGTAVTTVDRDTDGVVPTRYSRASR